jgi:hypothetical protein
MDMAIRPPKARLPYELIEVLLFVLLCDVETEVLANEKSYLQPTFK